MFQESEIINLILAICSVCIVLGVFLDKGLRRLHYFYVGFSFIVCALVFTVVEGVFWGDFFNLLEHMCYAMASLFFVAGVLYIRRSNDPTNGDRR